jgi:hypothetical protein
VHPDRYLASVALMEIICFLSVIFIVAECKIEYNNISSNSVRINLLCFKFLKCFCDCNKEIFLGAGGGGLA